MRKCFQENLLASNFRALWDPSAALSADAAATNTAHPGRRQPKSNPSWLE